MLVKISQKNSQWNGIEKFQAVLGKEAKKKKKILSIKLKKQN